MAKRALFSGAIFALLTACLLAAQDPLSASGAKSLNLVQFILVTQVTLLVAAPFLLMGGNSRRDFWKIYASPVGRRRLAALVLVGLAGLALYNMGLRNAHPVIISAILNLSPFWAALVARKVAGVPIAVSTSIFVGCLLLSFAGAMTVAYSQIAGDGPQGLAGVKDMLSKGSWYFAIPVPIFTALSGTLIGLWFKDYTDQASIAAAIVAPAVVLIPACLAYLTLSGAGLSIDPKTAALLAAGTICAGVVGRVFYQFALSRTDNDNGFVTMFFLLAPGLAGLYSWALSHWLTALKFNLNGLYFTGLAITAGAMLYFVAKSRAAENARVRGSRDDGMKRPVRDVASVAAN